jgi:hypothetical protein
MLQTVNAILALVHAALATTTLAVGNYDLRVEVYQTNLTFVPARDGRSFILIPNAQRSGFLYLTRLCALFFLQTALAHTLYATILRSAYERNLALQKSPFRWLEYAFSAPTCFVLVAYAAGIRNQSTLFATAALVGITMSFGHLHELLIRSDDGSKWLDPLPQRVRAHALGWFPQLAAWYIVLEHYIRNVTDGSGPPAWVSILVAFEVVLFLSFGFVQLMVTLTSPRHYLAGEYAYLALSLVSKAVLGLVFLSNVLVLSSFDCAYSEC